MNEAGGYSEALEENIFEAQNNFEQTDYDGDLENSAESTPLSGQQPVEEFSELQKEASYQGRLVINGRGKWDFASTFAGVEYRAGESMGNVDADVVGYTRDDFEAAMARLQSSGEARLVGKCLEDPACDTVSVYKKTADGGVSVNAYRRVRIETTEYERTDLPNHIFERGENNSEVKEQSPDQSESGALHDSLEAGRMTATENAIESNERQRSAERTPEQYEAARANILAFRTSGISLEGLPLDETVEDPAPQPQAAASTRTVDNNSMAAAA